MGTLHRAQLYYGNKVGDRLKSTTPHIFGLRDIQYYVNYSVKVGDSHTFKTHLSPTNGQLLVTAWHANLASCTS
jgi:hypothetical protein